MQYLFFHIASFSGRVQLKHLPAHRLSQSDMCFSQRRQLLQQLLYGTRQCFCELPDVDPIDQAMIHFNRYPKFQLVI